MICPLYRGCPLLRGSNRIILIGMDKFGDLVLSLVERYLIQCPFLGGSSLRGSTVVGYNVYLLYLPLSKARVCSYDKKSRLHSYFYQSVPALLIVKMLTVQGEVYVYGVTQCMWMKLLAYWSVFRKLLVSLFSTCHCS